MSSSVHTHTEHTYKHMYPYRHVQWVATNFSFFFFFLQCLKEFCDSLHLAFLLNKCHLKRTFSQKPSV